MPATQRRRPLVIAHRGASGYLPEHTLVAKAMAFAMGADYLEQDVVATRDGVLIVFHDLTLDAMTDVAVQFPGRGRPDGHFYCMDFTLAEIRRLSVAERRSPDGTAPRYGGRFPDGAGRFPIPTLAEELQFIQGLIRSTGRQVGIYPEIKDPAWHRQHGFDLGAALLDMLTRFGYLTAAHAVFVQCFDPLELQRLRADLGSRLQFVQLLDSASGLPSPDRLADIARYATVIGPSLRLICRATGGSAPVPTTLVADAHAAGLAVHPYTLRYDDLPTGIAGFDAALDLLLLQQGVDGIFTDFPDLAVRFVARHFPGLTQSRPQ